MGASRSSRTARTGRSHRLTEQELAALAAYEHYFAQADPELVARFELLWSLAASTPAQRPYPHVRLPAASTEQLHDAARHESRRRQLVRVLQLTVLATVAYAVLALVVLVGTHTVAAIASSAGHGLG